MPLVEPETQHPDQPMSGWRRYRFELLAGCILLVMAINLVSVTARKSITADEIVLIPSAYYYYVDSRVNLIGQHPPLCKLLAGLPLLFFQPNEWKPSKTDLAAPSDQREWNYITNFWRDNRPQFEAICFWSRLPMIALTLALGVLLFVFARELLGQRGALLAVVLFALEPTILAHGRVVQTDIPAAFGLLLTVYAIWKYIGAPDWKHACYLGGAAAVALLAKYSMLVVVPAIFAVIAILFFLPGARRRSLARDAVVAAVTLLLVVNAAYFFYDRALTPDDAKWIREMFPSSSGFLTAIAETLRWIVPADLVMGVYWQAHHGKIGHPAGLLGMHGNHGWWYYFPVAFFFKATIPFLALSIASGLWAAHRLWHQRERKWLVLLVPLVLYTALLSMSPINIGVRYYLPGYIFFILLSAALLDVLLRSQRRYRAMTMAITALAWMSFEAWRTYPNYIPYLNQFAYARPHWWYLSDSNVEWGDDSKELAAWLYARGQTRVRGLLLGCFATLDFYQINYVDALGAPGSPPPRYTALGASFLNGSTNPQYDIGGRPASDQERVNTFDSYRSRQPEAIIGNSIYIFRDGD